MKNSKKLPKYNLFNIESNDQEKSIWNKVGVGFENKDKSINLIINQDLKQNMKLQLREYTSKN